MRHPSGRKIGEVLEKVVEHLVACDGLEGEVGHVLLHPLVKRGVTADQGAQVRNEGVPLLVW